MTNIINEIGIENCFSILIIINLILLIGFIITILKTEKLKKKYENFMKKLGNGKTIEEDLENYMYRVERVEKQNAEIANFIQILDKDLEKCIQSVINQTYENLQIILVDDGSPDNCGKICDEYAKKDHRIEVIHKSNGGLSDARNKGLEIAKGEYIGFVDSDDYIEADMYEVLYNLLKQYNADVSICNFYTVSQEKIAIKNADNGIKEYTRIEILKEILLDNNIQSYAWNKLYKKELFDEIKYPVGKKYEDIGTTFYLLEKCNKVVVTGKPEYYYINRQDSIVNNVTETTITDYIELIMQRYDYIEENIKELSNYNKNYLKRILKTAEQDIKSLNKVGDYTKKKYEELYNKVQKI